MSVNTYGLLFRFMKIFTSPSHKTEFQQFVNHYKNVINITSSPYLIFYNKNIILCSIFHIKRGNENEKRLVTIGNGMAGIRCMEEILKHDSDSYEITILR